MARKGPAYYRSVAARFAKQEGVPVNVFLNQIGTEAGWRTNATSHAGARGIAQIMPFHDVRPDLPGHQTSGADPIADLRWAARHNAQNLRKYGNVKDMLSVYNSGRPWSQGRNISETRNYVNKIMGGGPGTNVGNTVPFELETPEATGTPRDGVRNFLMSSLMNYANTGHVLGPMELYKAARTAELDVPTMDEDTPQTPLGSVGRGSFKGEGFRIVEAMKQAQRMGLSVRENPLYDKVDPVHTHGSHHYRTYKDTKIGQAADISGDPKRMAAFFNWSRRRYGSGISELIYDPIGSVFDGQYKRGAYGGHGSHVHIAFGSR
jgi:hypothetical protein